MTSEQTNQQGAEGDAFRISTPEDLPGVPLFLESFAAFLRQHRTLWRTRRVDRFIPLDLDLADHHISIQGLIDAEMLNAFLGRAAPLGLPPITARRGQKITLYIPAMSAPKRLLLQFSARSEVDEPLPVISRTEGSAIAARDIVSQLLEKRRDTKPRVENAKVVPIQLLVSSLVFSNPHRLAERLEHWSGRKHRVTPDQGLAHSDLSEWVRHEGDEFAVGGGDVLVAALSVELDKLKQGLGPRIKEDVRRDGLAYFPTLRSLLLHGIQDLLKTIVQSTEPWRTDGDREKAQGRAPLNARVLAVEEFPALAARAADVFTALDVLEELTDPQNQVDRSAIEELYLHLDRWTAYAVCEVELGVPFVMKFNQTLPLTPQTPLHEERWHTPPMWRRPAIKVDQKRRLWFTSHVYPLAPQDALSVHAEVVIDDPQLRMDHRSEVVSEVGPKHRRRVVEIVYGHELRPTGRLLHRYSSRRPEAYRITDPIYVRVRLKVIRSISRGYLFASLAFLLAGTYTSWTFFGALSHHSVIAKPDLPLTIAAVAATLSLWLTATQHPRPVVYRKLWLARRAFYVSLLAILIPLLLYGARQAKPQWFHPSARGVEWFIHLCGNHPAWTVLGIAAAVVCTALSRSRRRRSARARLMRLRHAVS